MYKALSIVAVVAVVGAILVVPALAGKEGRAGKSNIAHENLDSVSGECPDAWGRIKYNVSGDSLDFVFNGHGLISDDLGEGQCFALYSSGKLLGVGACNEGGDVHIMAVVTDSGTLQAIENNNVRKFNLWVSSEDGTAKVLRVLQSDVFEFDYTPPE